MRLLPYLFFTFFVIFSNCSYAESANTDQNELTSLGREVYEAKGCSICHMIDGIGGSLGPDLTNEGNIISHDAEWHKQHLINPQSVVPGSSMPASDLSEKELEALISYMLSLKSVDLPKDVEGAMKMARERLNEARMGINEIKKHGFNVDTLEIRYIEGWTHLETINNMIYTHNLAGVYQETDEALAIAKEISQEVLSYKIELEHRVTQLIILIMLFVFIVVLVFIKLLTI